MKPELSYASSLILRECTITTVDGETLDITDLVVRLDYFESISLPTIEANLDLVDTGSNIISSLPIQGYEDIKFTIAINPNLNFTRFKYSNKRTLICT